jgi:hypothetical protein
MTQIRNASRATPPPGHASGSPRAAPPPSPPGPGSAKPTARKERRDCLPLYRRHAPRLGSVEGALKKHKHIDPLSKYEIVGINENIEAAINSNDRAEVARQLEKLLDKPFFKPSPIQSDQSLAAVQAAFDRLDECGIRANQAEVDRYADQFARALVEREDRALLNAKKNSAKRQAAIAQKARRYLATNRADKSSFQTRLVKLELADNVLPQRCSAQKMALEIFSKALPFVVSKHGDDHLSLMKSLINVLPHLEHPRSLNETRNGAVCAWLKTYVPTWDRMRQRKSWRR